MAVQAGRIGVVADTHVGEWVAELPQAVLAALAGVDLILHAGDIRFRQSLPPEVSAPAVGIIEAGPGGLDARIVRLAPASGDSSEPPSRVAPQHA